MVDIFFNPSRLRNRINILREDDVSDGKGGWNRGWVAIETSVPAEVISQNGREALVARSLQGINTYKITVRHRTDLLASDQIVLEDGSELNVLSFCDPDGQRVTTEIYATSETPQGA